LNSYSDGLATFGKLLGNFIGDYTLTAPPLPLVVNVTPPAAGFIPLLLLVTFQLSVPF